MPSRRPEAGQNRAGNSGKETSGLSHVRPVVIVMGICLVLIFLTAASLCVPLYLIRSADAEVKGISVSIVDNICNVTVDMDINAPAGNVGKEVRLVHGNGSEPLRYRSGTVQGTVTEEAFRSMLSDGEVKVRGMVELEILGLLRLKHGLSETFDISTLASSLKDLVVSNVTVTPTLRGYMVLRMELSSTIDERLDIMIERTPADLRISTGTYGVSVESLEVRGSTGKGSCTLYVPTAAILSIAFLDRNVSFDCYGISGTFVLPQ